MGFVPVVWYWDELRRSLLFLRMYVWEKYIFLKYNYLNLLSTILENKVFKARWIIIHLIVKHTFCDFPNSFRAHDLVYVFCLIVSMVRPTRSSGAPHLIVVSVEVEDPEQSLNLRAIKNHRHTDWKVTGAGHRTHYWHLDKCFFWYLCL